ncbi:MAG: pyruvate kinase [Deltaproteobacteria bacterium]|nr:pyruvate kinase [Deltaproteobacteria bacterium]
MRKTKIVATAGPSSSSPQKIEALVNAGVDVFRLNLSHGDREGHARVLSSVRAVSGRLGRPVAALLDLQGPKIRVGALSSGPVTLKTGERLTITTGEAPGTSALVSTTYKDLCKDVRPGARILIDDGLMEAVVLEVNGADVVCRVVTGGILKGHKGLNLPGAKVSAPSLTPKDIEDIAFGTSAGVDYIALSFVRKAADVVELKKAVKAANADIPIIAKIETAEAVSNLASIMNEADGVMIARGDLGVEMTPEAVPVLQKRIIALANAAGKTVITATQMLESMITNPRPTRAEASDVANAVYDGTDALMLSGETAVGKYPAEAVEMMAKIAVEAEEAIEAHNHRVERPKEAPGSFAQAVTYAAYAACTEVSPKALVVFSQTGATARMLAQLRPRTRIIAFTMIASTMRRLALVWGVEPFLIEFGRTTDEMICRGEGALLEHGIAAWGDTIIVISGTKVGMRGATNMMKIDWIGSEECRVYFK